MINPATNPNLENPTLAESLARKTAAAASLLGKIACEWRPAVFASSLGAEDMVITDLIVREHLPIEIFSLDTGRLPAETYDLMHDLQTRYGLKLRLYYPRNDLIEDYTREYGINAFTTRSNCAWRVAGFERSNRCSAPWPTARHG